MRMRNITLIMLAIVLALSGCTAQNTGYSAQTARPLQQQVLAVAESATAGQPSVSLTRLDELMASLADARAKGTVSDERYASIAAAIALVRSDLEVAIATQNEQQQQDQQDQQKNEKPGKGAGKKKP
jgi:lipoprotein NlpI